MNFSETGQGYMPLSKGFYLGEWLVRPQLNLIHGPNGQSKIEPRVMAVLVALAEYDGEPVPKEALMQRVWGTTYLTDDVVSRCISELRRTFDDSRKNPRVIETIWKVGYRLLPPITMLEDVSSLEDKVVVSDQATSGSVRPITQDGGDDDAGIECPGRLVWKAATFLLLILEIVMGLSLLSSSEQSDASLLANEMGDLITTLPGEEIGPALSPEGERVAFAWRGLEAPGLNLWVQQVGTDTPIQLTFSEASDIHPAWSPDGLWIAFVRRSSEGCGIYVIPTIGRNERLVTACSSDGAMGLTWSPDQQSLVFSDRVAKDGPFKLFSIGLEATGRMSLTQTTLDEHDELQPRFSPDGSKIAFLRGDFRGQTGDLYVVPAAGGEARRITRENSWIKGHDWAPNGAQLIFASDRGDGPELYIVGASGGEPRLFRRAGTHVESPSVAQSGSRLVFSRRTTPIDIWELRHIDEEFGPVKPLIQSTRFDWSPAYSPNSDKIAFLSNRSGTAQLWLASSEGEEQSRLTNVPGQGVLQASWSSDGSRLALVSRSDERFQLQVLDLEMRLFETVFEDVFPIHDSSWSADGRWIYFGSERVGASTQIWKVVSDGEGDPVQVTQGGGLIAHEAPSGDILYVQKRFGGGLWRVPVDGDAMEEEPVEGLPKDRIESWVVTNSGIYLVTSEDCRAIFHRWEPSQGGRRIGQINQQTCSRRFQTQLAVSADGERILYALPDAAAADLVLISDAFQGL